jgi:myo-inositol-1(or 4)-monophosphatase
MVKPVELAKRAACEAAKLIASFEGKGKISQKNSAFNLVTQADTEAEKLITGILKEGLPGSSILAEESYYSEDINKEKLWIVDPLDGTNNFAHGIPQFSVSIAYAESGQVKAGVVFDINRNELFCAEEGAGAFLNEKRISVSERKNLTEAIVSTGFYYDRGELVDKTLLAVKHLLKANVHGIRRFGSAALDLCWVACGRFDAYFEYTLSPWDYAAGMLIIREAGGCFCDRMGKKGGLESRSVICSNSLLNEEIINMVRWA